MISFCARLWKVHVICFTAKNSFCGFFTSFSSLVAATAQSELLALINFFPFEPRARASRSQHQICRRLIVFCLPKPFRVNFNFPIHFRIGNFCCVDFCHFPTIFISQAWHKWAKIHKWGFSVWGSDKNWIIRFFRELMYKALAHSAWGKVDERHL